MRDLSLHLMDILQNSIVAGATQITILYEELPQNHTLTISIEDNGCGMDTPSLEKITNPFYTTRTTRDVGLGIPLFKMSAEATKGSFFIGSTLGKGTHLQGFFRTDHINMIPQGDTAGTLHLMMTGNPELSFHFTQKKGDQQFSVSTDELHSILGEDIPLSHPDISLWLKSYLEEGIHTVRNSNSEPESLEK